MMVKQVSQQSFSFEYAQVSAQLLADVQITNDLFTISQGSSLSFWYNSFFNLFLL